MLVALGSFDNGTPSLKFLLGGVANEKEFTAVIDTGFSGFVSMPMIQAFPLGLPLFGTTTVTLADGKSQTKLVAQGKAQLSDKQHFGLVILESGSSDVLIGMDFLRAFGLALLVMKARIGLYDEEKVQKALQEEAQDADAEAKPATRRKPKKPKPK